MIFLSCFFFLLLKPASKVNISFGQVYSTGVKCELFILSSSDLLMMAFDQLGSMSYWPLNLSLCPISRWRPLLFQETLMLPFFSGTGSSKRRHYNDIHESAKKKNDKEQYKTKSWLKQNQKKKNWQNKTKNWQKRTVKQPFLSRFSTLLKKIARKKLGLRRLWIKSWSAGFFFKFRSK